MVAPWERGWVEPGKEEPPKPVVVPIPNDLSESLKDLPRIAMLVAVPACILGVVLLFSLYGMLQNDLGVDTGGSRRRGSNSGASHPIEALLIFIPFFVVSLAILVRYLIMQKIATELSRKIARKIKCTDEFEKALFKFVVRAPWSKWTYRLPRKASWGNGYYIPRGSSVSAVFHRVDTQHGDSRMIEISDDRKFFIIHPQEWVDTPTSLYGQIGRALNFSM